MHVFFAEVEKKSANYNLDEVMTVEIVDYDFLLKHVLEGECFDATLSIAVLLTSMKKLLE